jgi:hypothetical membrane protein
MASRQLAGLLGILIPVYFLAVLIAFGLMTPGYAHSSKAVSELGAFGAPLMLEWNAMGFGLTGALLAAFGAAFPGSAGARWALFVTGAAFAATAIPADLEDYRSPATMAHMAASIVSFAAWIWALGGQAYAAPRGFRALSIAFLGLAVASIVLRGSDIVWPGTGQRVSFAVFFGWYFAAGLMLSRQRG